MMARRRSRSRKPGPATDSHGSSAFDPTDNVLNLVDAAIQRQDDLRIAESGHREEMADLRAGYEEKLRLAESARINAIRDVDVTAVSRASQVASEQATILAAQVQVSAEALRARVEASASAAATALGAALAPMQKDITDLRAAQYKQQGERSQQSESRERSSTSMGLALTVGILVVMLFGAITALVTLLASSH